MRPLRKIQAELFRGSSLMMCSTQEGTKDSNRGMATHRVRNKPLQYTAQCPHSKIEFKLFFWRLSSFCRLNSALLRIKLISECRSPIVIVQPDYPLPGSTAKGYTLRRQFADPDLCSLFQNSTSISLGPVPWRIEKAGGKLHIGIGSKNGADRDLFLCFRSVTNSTYRLSNAVLLSSMNRIPLPNSLPWSSFWRFDLYVESFCRISIKSFEIEW